MSEKAKILKTFYLDEYTVDGKGTFHNFGVALEGHKQAFFISVKDKANPKLDVGSELEFDVQGNIVKKYAVNNKLTDFTKIKRVQANRMGFGSSGYAKDPNQAYNILVTTCCQKAVEYVISRHNTNIETDFEPAFNKLMEVVEPKLK